MTVGTCAIEVSKSLCPERGFGVSSSSFLLSTVLGNYYHEIILRARGRRIKLTFFSCYENELDFGVQFDKQG